MEAVKFVVVLLVIVFLQVVGALGNPLTEEDGEGGEMWAVEKWQGYPVERGIAIRLADLIKRSKAQQFHGLMGRSPGASQPVRPGRKRNNNKGEMFVGLMGRRNLGDMDEEWTTESY